MHKKILLCSISLTALILSGSQAISATTDTSAGNMKADAASAGDNHVNADIEDIVVTATHRREALSKVPMSITALSKEVMDEMSIRTTYDLAQQAPALTIHPGILGVNSIAIRGIESDGAGTTGIYIDDTPIQVRSLGADAYNVYPLVFDLQRVEVLRGPQGSLFGSGSLGGAVRFITPEPSLTDTSVYARADMSAIEKGSMSYEAGVAYGAPLIKDKVGLRVSGWFQHQGGFIDNFEPATGETIQKNINQSESKVFRAAIAAALSDRLTITPSFYFQEQKIDDIGQYWAQYSDPSSGDFRAGITTPQPTKDRFTLSALKLNYKGEGFTIFSNTSYFARTMHAQYDYSTLIPALLVAQFLPPDFPHYPAYALFRNTQKSWTQEIRIQSDNSNSPFSWLVGGFFNDAKQTSAEDLVDSAFNDLLTTYYGLNVQQIFGVPMLSGNKSFHEEDSAQDRQYAVFGELGLELTKGLKITAGGRFAHMKATQDSFAEGPINGGVSSFIGSVSANAFTPKAEITYQATEDSMYYGLISKGFRPGGINRPVPYTPGACQTQQNQFGGPAPLSYKPDTVWNYEVGTKQSLFNNRLKFSASAYYLKWKNKQQGLNACAFAYVANLTEAESKGFELEASLKVIQNVTVGGSLSYTYSAYSKDLLGTPNPVTGAPTYIITSGDAILNQPWSATANIQYDFTTFSAPSYIRFDYHYQGGYREDPGTNPQDTSYVPFNLRLQPVNMLNGRIGVDLGNWAVSVYSTNILNNHTPIHRFLDSLSLDGLYKQTILQPRTFGLTAVAHY